MMRWEKLGLIFDVAKNGLPPGCIGFAQSPQTLVFDDFVRVYFSTRRSDAPGKFISTVAFADFSHDFSKVIRVSRHEVLAPGALGCYDEHGVFPFHVLRDGKRILGFISGWSRRVSVDIETGIGLSESFDNGETFQRIGSGPILSATIDEPFLVCDPFVLKQRDVFHMWYIYGVRWIPNPETGVLERVYKIGHAQSENALDWQKTGRQLISDRLDANECQALPSVIYHNSQYLMVFCYREAFGFRTDPSKTYRLDFAVSDDGLNWERQNRLAEIHPDQNGWDTSMQCYPHLCKTPAGLFLLYNGNAFGREGFGAAKLIS
jgi:hypothetical protein